MSYRALRGCWIGVPEVDIRQDITRKIGIQEHRSSTHEGLDKTLAFRQVLFNIVEQGVFPPCPFQKFLKWAGGKYPLLDDIKKHLPKGECLIEPFVGAGSVFLNTDFSRYILADINFRNTDPAPTKGSIRHSPFGRCFLISSSRGYFPPAHFRKARFFFMLTN